jgi:anti-sigma B factor antagonist
VAYVPDPDAFQLRCTREPGATVIEIIGELDALTGPRLRAQTIEAINDGTMCLILDMGGVAFIDSYGIGVLVGAHERIGDKGGSLVLRRVQPHTHKVLAVTDLDNMFTIAEELNPTA